MCEKPINRPPCHVNYDIDIRESDLAGAAKLGDNVPMDTLKEKQTVSIKLEMTNDEAIM